MMSHHRQCSPRSVIVRVNLLADLQHVLASQKVKTSRSASATAGSCFPYPQYDFTFSEDLAPTDLYEADTS